MMIMKLSKSASAVQISLMIMGAAIALFYFFNDNNLTLTVLFLFIAPIFIANGIVSIKSLKWWHALSILFGLGFYCLYFFREYFNGWWYFAYFLIALVAEDIIKTQRNLK